MPGRYQIDYSHLPAQTPSLGIELLGAFGKIPQVGELRAMRSTLLKVARSASQASVLLLLVSVVHGLAAQETIVAIRHGEKPRKVVETNDARGTEFARVGRDDTFSFVARFPHVDIRGRPSRIKNGASVCSHGCGKRTRAGKRRKTRRNQELNRAMLRPVSRGAVVNDGSRVEGRRRREAGRSNAYTRHCR